MKKLLALMALVLCLVVAFAACSDNKGEVPTNGPATEAPTEAPAVCSHEYDNDCDAECNLCGEKREPSAHVTVEIPAVEATCTSTGLTAGEKCSVCGEITKAQEVVPAKEHTEVEIPAKAATCTTSGNTAGRKCTVCNHITYGTVIPALGHDEAELPAVEATCTSTGLTAGKKCLTCGETTVRQETIAKKAHTEAVTPAKSATCTEDGLSEGKYCTVCGTITVAQQTISKKGHTPGAAATCTEAQTCTVCQAVLNPATGHVKTTVSLAPTCNDSGYENRLVCLVCGEIYENGTVLPALGHEWVDATCDVAKHCSRCNVMTGTALGHKYGDYVSNNDATCTADGTKSADCERCDAVSTIVDEDTALGHNFENYVSNNDAACQQNGTKTAKCSRCDATHTVEDEGSMLGHDWVDYEGRDETCTEDGWEAYSVCSTCGKSTYVAKPAHHKMTTSFAEDATCTSEGMRAGEYCIVCNYGYAELVIPKLDHAWGEYVSNNDATCLFDGTKTATCDNCDTTDTVADEGSAGHAWGEYTSNGDATCTADGTKTATCSRCGNVDTIADEGSALGHDTTDHDAKAPTCTEIGWDAYVTCSRCDYTTYEEKPSNGHTEKPVEAIAETCTQNGLTAGVKCEVCEIVISGCQVIPAHHTYVTVIGYAATCYEDGLTDGVKCSVCDDWQVEQNTIPALAHANRDDDTGVCPDCGDGCAHENTYGYAGFDATCEKDGLIAGERCLVCDAYSIDGKWIKLVGDNWVDLSGESEDNYNEEIIIAGGHTWGDYTSNGDATCTEDGTKTATCSRCGESNTIADEGSALGHDLADATCTAPQTCKRDGCEYTEGAALGHDLADATCTAPQTCKREGCEYTEGDALGHDPINHDAKAPTCTEIGWDAYETCSRCNHTTYVEKPANGHAFTKGDCQTKCDNCDYVRESATDHTESVDGCTITCDVCGESRIKHVGFKYGQCTGCGMNDPAYSGVVMSFKEFYEATDENGNYYIGSNNGEISGGASHDGYVLPSQGNWSFVPGSATAHTYNGQPIKIASNATMLNIAFSGWVSFGADVRLDTFGVFVDGITSTDQIIYNDKAAHHLDMYNGTGVLVEGGFHNHLAGVGEGNARAYYVTLFNTSAYIWNNIKTQPGIHTVYIVAKMSDGALGVVFNQEIEVVDHVCEYPAEGTTGVGEVVPPTCEEDGYTKVSCNLSGALCPNTGTINKVDALGHNYSEEWTYSNGKHYHACLNAGCTSRGNEAVCSGANGVTCDTCHNTYGCRHLWEVKADGAIKCNGMCGASINAPVNYYAGEALYNAATTGNAATFTNCMGGTTTYNSDGYVTIAGNGTIPSNGDSQGCIFCLANPTFGRYIVLRYKSNVSSYLMTADHTTGGNAAHVIPASEDWTTVILDRNIAGLDHGRIDFRFHIGGGDGAVTQLSHVAMFDSLSAAQDWSETYGKTNETCVSKGHDFHITNNSTEVACATCNGLSWSGAAPATTIYGDSLGACPNPAGGSVTLASNGRYATIGGNDMATKGTMQWICAGQRYVVVLYRNVSSSFNSLLLSYLNTNTSQSSYAFLPYDGTNWTVGVADMKCTASQAEGAMFGQGMNLLCVVPDNTGTGLCDVAGFWTFTSLEAAEEFANAIKVVNCEGLTETVEDPCANGHTWGAYTSNGDATCTEDGTKTAKCNNCDETNTIADAGSALGHDLADATCTAPKTCKRENCNYTEDSALGHDLAPATCQEPAKCKRDGCEYTEGDVGAHDEIAIGDAQDATCTEAGITAGKKCSVCGTIIEEQQTVPATGHTFTKGDCQTKCDNCDYVRESATAHTETTEGCTITCEVCGESRIKHAGFKYGQCTGCGINDPAYSDVAMSFKDFYEAQDNDGNYYLAGGDIAESSSHDGYVLPSQGNWSFNPGDPTAHTYNGKPIKIASNATMLNIAFSGWISFGADVRLDTYGVFVDGITSADQIIYNDRAGNHLDMYNGTGVLVEGGFHNHLAGVGEGNARAYYVTLFNTSAYIWNNIKTQPGIHTVYIVAKMSDGELAVVFSQEIEVVDHVCEYPAEGTTGVGEVVDPTCEEDGYTKVTCNLSGALCPNTSTINKVDALGHNYSEEWTYSNGKHYHACLNTGCASRSDEATCVGADEATCDTCGNRYACRHLWEVKADGAIKCNGICGASINAPANYYAGEALYTAATTGNAATFTNILGGTTTYNSDGYVTIAGNGTIPSNGDTQGCIFCLANGSFGRYVVLRYKTNVTSTLWAVDHSGSGANTTYTMNATDEWTTLVIDRATAALPAQRIDFRFHIGGGDGAVTQLSHVAMFDTLADVNEWVETFGKTNETCRAEGHDIRLAKNNTEIACAVCNGLVWGGNPTECMTPADLAIAAGATNHGGYATVPGSAHVQYTRPKMDRYLVIAFRKGTASYGEGLMISYYVSTSSYPDALVRIPWAADGSWQIVVKDMETTAAVSNTFGMLPDFGKSGAPDIAGVFTFATMTEANEFAAALAKVDLTKGPATQDPCAGGHTWGSYTSNGDATCTDDGTKTAKCDNCDETNTIADAGSALGHDLAPATCQEPAKCKRDGCEYTEGDVGAHDEIAIGDAQNATCTEAGITAGKKCSVCGTIIEEQQTVPATGHNKVDNTCTNCGLVWVTLAEAAELEDGTNVVISGQVRLINTAWNSQFNNISVTIYDDNGNSYYIYRLGTEVELGDIITVTGTVTTYNGSKQINAGATATIDGHEELPIVYVKTELADISSVEDNSYVEVTGTVISIDTPWSSSYGNITVTIGDGNGNTFQLYRLATNVALCDVITVKGYKTSYNGNIQMGAGATATIAETKNHSFAAATCTEPKTCTVCSTTEGDSLGGHDYGTDGKCTRCGAVEGAVTPTTTTASVTISEYATTNKWSNSTQYEKVEIDSNITATATGGQNTGKYYNSGTQWRFYQNESPTLTITASNGKTIKSVKITYAIDKSGTLTYGGSNISSNTVVDVNASSISFGVGNTGSANNGQVRVTAIEVVYC